MDQTDQCFICKDNIRAKQQKLQCTGCFVSIHRTCTKMTQAKYREYVKDNQVNRIKCDICDASGKIQIKDLIDLIDKRPSPRSTGENSMEIGAITSPSERDRVASLTGSAIYRPAGTSPVQIALSASARTSPVQNVVSTSAGTQSITSSAVIVQSPLLNSTVVSPSITGQSLTLTSSALPNIPTSTVAQSTLSTATGLQSTMSTSTEGPSLSSSSPTSLSRVSTANDNGEQNPFFEKIEELLTSSLVGSYEYTHNSYLFSLKDDVLKQLKENLRSKKNDIAVKLRFWIVTDKGEVKPGLPEGVNVRVNWRTPAVLKQDNGNFSVAGMKDSIDITDLLELRGDENRLRISFIKSHTLHFACEVFKMKTINELLEGISVRPVQETRDFIMSKFKTDDDCEVATTNIKASLTCPIGKMRLSKPCRSKNCSHIQCIDARTILGMNKMKKVWKCPVCQQPAGYPDLYIDGLFIEILETVPWNIVEIEILEDGSWTYKGTKDTGDTDKENICVMLDETIDKLEVIDLTETDEEGTPIKKAPLKTNNTLMNKYPAVKNLIEEVASTIDKVRNLDKQISTTSGCHRNKRKHFRQAGPYDRNRVNGSKHYNDYYSSRHTGSSHEHYKQVSLDRYRWSNAWRNTVSDGWRGYNSSHVDSNRWGNNDSTYNWQNESSNTLLSIVFRPFNNV
ncbi:E3 SUMO-protein ligase PIAS4-A-like [Ruditapes philippinarum]|uniref:E3 SUMO-protein ligase PIAS4-A-like n=1 Tax=Ruditapes philippinarum TaxID=129788 RepID=UPI00295B536A|nr:E3 SUMO-protein ligase PIAS4-A-like [Ruditapes philippinarum]XP_060559056.1 E3 SUMO-protein ligase PIAS4-A-like [Ruditapes philippinarum]